MWTTSLHRSQYSVCSQPGDKAWTTVRHRVCTNLLRTRRQDRFQTAQPPSLGCGELMLWNRQMLIARVRRCAAPSVRLVYCIGYYRDRYLASNHGVQSLALWNPMRTDCFLSTVIGRFAKGIVTTWGGYGESATATATKVLCMHQLLRAGRNRSKPPHFGEEFAVPGWMWVLLVIATGPFSHCGEGTLQSWDGSGYKEKRIEPVFASELAGAPISGFKEWSMTWCASEKWNLS